MNEALTTPGGNRLVRPLLAVVAIAALGLGLWFGLDAGRSRPAPMPALESATHLQPPKPLQAFALTAHDGTPFTLESLAGNWNFLAFGYTHCPDICPTTLATLDAVAERSAAVGAEPRFVFVSVDPERDTLSRLAEYVPYFNPAFVGVTGTHPELQKLTRQLGVLYRKEQTPDSAMHYVVDHSASILLIDPRGRLAAIFSPPHDPAAMTRDVITIQGQLSERH